MSVQNYLTIRDQINKIAKQPVEIEGVTKRQSPETIRPLVQAGLKILANNYVQDGKTLFSLFPTVAWHFIGHIQSRKAKDLVDYSVVESIDRIEVARKLNEKLLAIDKQIEILVEINIGEEVGKSGIRAHQLPAFLEGLKELKQLRPSGLMGMPPPLENIEARRPFFRQLKDLYETHRAVGFQYLSMGTSEDYFVAVEEGANRVRLGTALFGARE